MAQRALQPASIDDLLDAIRQGLACEIVAGEVVEKAVGDERHGDAQLELGMVVRGGYNRRPAPRGPPGGWWIRSEVDIRFGDDVYRPDLSGWRRDRVPRMPEEWPVPVAPDWVAEILSASTAARDLGVKMRAYLAAGVGHYWVVDRQHEVLTVFRRNDRAYEVALTAIVGERVRAEPFEAVEIDVGRLFGVESDDEVPE
jgi:Uma2 family endonuclease